MKYSLILAMWLITIGYASCQGQRQDRNTEESEYSHFPYRLIADVEHAMPEQLAEISGIAFVKGDEHTLYAVQDEEGLLFGYDLLQKQIASTASFAQKGDYEELATDGQFFYVLKSNGHIYSFSVGHTSAAGEVIVNKDLVPKGEYESMAFDPASGNLFLLCKACKMDKQGEEVSGYILKIGQGGDCQRRESLAYKSVQFPL